MLTLPLTLAAPVAWLASDRLLLQGLSEQHSAAPDLANRLAAANFPASAAFDQMQHWQRALLDYQPSVGTRIRNEDATAAIQHFSQELDYSTSGAVGFYQQAPGQQGQGQQKLSQQSLHLQCLQQLSQQLLYWQGQCFEVRPKRLQEWLTLASVMDVSWVIAQAYCHELNERRLSVSEALHAMLKVQCAVALPKPDEFEQYADNHVHLNGHGHTNASMLDMALHVKPISIPTDSFATDTSLTPKQQKQLNSWPHRAEYSVFESGRLSKLILPKLVRCLGGRLGLEVLSGGNDKFSNVTLAQLPFIQPEDLTGLYAQPNINAKPHKQLLCHAENPQFASQQRWLVWCCGLLLFESSAQRQDFSDHKSFSPQLLGFIRASNVLRNYMVVSGVGLGQFVEFFGFQHSKSGRGVTAAGFDNEPGSFREFRIGPDKIVSRAKEKSSNNKAEAKPQSGYRLRTLPFEKLVNELKHVYPNDNMHFVLHFVRSFPENQDAARNQPRWQHFRSALLQQVQKLQAFHASVTHSDRNDIGKPLVIEGTDSSVDLREFVRGYDVAGNENELPIEVFASALRVLRAGKQPTVGEFSKRLPNPFLTVHCGEDFNHILSGLRAIDEAVNFCDYQPGDRLGHALALGLDVNAWATRQQTLYLTAQQHLDNLVWCHYQALHICGLVSEHVAEFNNIVVVLAQKIDYWANYLGLGGYSVNDLYQGWKLRRNCPRALELTRVC